MLRIARLILLVSGILLMAAPVSAQETQTPAPDTASMAAPSVTYTVRPGDTLFRIAQRFNISLSILAQANGITNTSLIYVGQVLAIPGATPLPSSTPTVPLPPSPIRYTVQRGDTLHRIAIRFGTTIGELLRLNNLSNPNLIYVGQSLLVPDPNLQAPTSASEIIPTETPASLEMTAEIPSPTAEPPNVEITPSSTPLPALPPEAANPDFTVGISAFFGSQSAAQVIDQIQPLGVDWVKVDVLWRELETTQGLIDFGELDMIVNALQNAGFRILFTVSSSPTWARSSVDESGPPDDLALYANFARELADRYAGQVQAYQIWNEPNLRREWNSDVHAISAQSYLQLLRLAYEAIKAGDANALVISAGLAPTGFNDGINAINDRGYLSALYAAGLAEVSDGIGVHPGGWANPPDARCCAQPAGVETHFDDPSFFFLDTLTAYREIMVSAGDTATRLWVTKFGWGTAEDTDPPSSINVFYTYTDLGEQAVYTPRALELGANLGYIGPMFIFNLNGCVARPRDSEACYTSLIAADGTPRPVYNALISRAQTDSP